MTRLPLCISSCLFDVRKVTGLRVVARWPVVAGATYDISVLDFRNVPYAFCQGRLRISPS